MALNTTREFPLQLDTEYAIPAHHTPIEPFVHDVREDRSIYQYGQKEENPWSMAWTEGRCVRT